MGGEVRGKRRGEMPAVMRSGCEEIAGIGGIELGERFWGGRV